MATLHGHLNVFLDHVHIGSSGGDFRYSINVPPGRHPLVVEHHDGVIGRATLILDPENAEESFAEELYEPLDSFWLEDIVLAGDAARTLWERLDRPTIDGDLQVDPTGANILRLPTGGASVEVAWWYGGDGERPDEGICALDLVWNPALDPVSTDNPARNMGAIVSDFLNTHGPPSLRTPTEDDS